MDQNTDTYSCFRHTYRNTDTSWSSYSVLVLLLPPRRLENAYMCCFRLSQTSRFPILGVRPCSMFFVWVLTFFIYEKVRTHTSLGVLTFQPQSKETSVRGPMKLFRNRVVKLNNPRRWSLKQVYISKIGVNQTPQVWRVIFSTLSMCVYLLWVKLKGICDAFHYFLSNIMLNMMLQVQMFMLNVDTV